jgi:hypothetical protein
MNHEEVIDSVELSQLAAVVLTIFFVSFISDFSTQPILLQVDHDQSTV